MRSDLRDLRVALDFVCLAEVRFLDTVDFGDFDVLLLQGGRGLLIVRSESLAMPTPEDTR